MAYGVQTPTNVAQTVQQCITRCQQSAQDLRSVSAQVQNPQAKTTFTQAAQQIEKCVQDCQNALPQI